MSDEELELKLHSYLLGSGAIFQKGDSYFISSHDNPAHLDPLSLIMVYSFCAKWGYRSLKNPVAVEPKDWPKFTELHNECNPDYNDPDTLDELEKSCDNMDHCGDRGNQHIIRKLIAIIRNLKSEKEQTNIR